MATPKGYFDKEQVGAAWFDPPSATDLAQFDTTLLDSGVVNVSLAVATSAEAMSDANLLERDVLAVTTAAEVISASSLTARSALSVGSSAEVSSAVNLLERDVLAISSSAETSSAAAIASRTVLSITSSNEAESDSELSGGSVSTPTGNQVVPNTVARLGNLFLKTAYNVGIREPSLAIKRFLEDLKIERKKALTQERRKLAAMKAEKVKVEASLTELPAKPRTPERTSVTTVLRGKVGDLEAQIAVQSQIVRERRREVEEADKARAQATIDAIEAATRSEIERQEREQARIDALAENALREWIREEAIRRAEKERQDREDEEMMAILLVVHE